MAVAAFWSTSSSSMAKTSEPDSPSSRSKSLAGLELDGLVVPSPRASTSKSVSSKMSFSALPRAGVAGVLADGLAGGAAGVGLISSPLRGASSIELARRRGRTAADPCRLIPESLGRPRLIPERPGRPRSRPSRPGRQRGDLELVAGVQGRQLEVAARLGLQGVDDAGGGQLEVAVASGSPAGTSAEEPARGSAAGRVARARAEPDERPEAMLGVSSVISVTSESLADLERGARLTSESLADLGTQASGRRSRSPP